MHRLLLCLPLLSLPIAQAEPHHHAPLSAHQHGVAQLNIALDDTQVSLELLSPAANLLGFEQRPHTPEQQQQLEQLTLDLAKPQELFGFAQHCQLQTFELDHPLVQQDSHKHHEHQHSDIAAHYQLSCTAAPQSLNLQMFFSRFPNTQILEVQLISEQGQLAARLSMDQTELAL